MTLLDDVASLNDDLLVRRYIELIQSTLRTNYYQPDENGEPKDYLSFKLDPSQITGMPKPRPMFEIFVYRRGSRAYTCAVARWPVVACAGRIVVRISAPRCSAWSRPSRSRTRSSCRSAPRVVSSASVLPEGGDRDAIQQEGIACYKIFIRALLDVTDNLEAGEVVPPLNVVRHDADDPYLVVAADKGTATFSDIANEISLEYGHWLRDAFASGGANGYDHKKMGITAKGAWESVKRHFREQGVNTQADEFSVVGIGDMAGDVFGNGMLLSDKIRLLGAFNHLHIFVDPTPDVAAPSPSASGSSLCRAPAGKTTMPLR